MSAATIGKASGDAPGAGASPSVIPPVAATVAAELPTVAERTLPGGLRVLVVRRTTVPLVEVRLRIPFTGLGAAHQARGELLAETLFTGTQLRDRVELATVVQSLGGALSTWVDADRLAIVGSALATNLVPLLDLIAEVLTGATYPSGEFAGERDRLVEEATIAHSQPALIAREGLLRRLYGDHPYGSETPVPDVVSQVTEADVRTLHAARVSPVGAVLTLVGDVEPQAALERVEAVLGDWRGTAADAVPPLPALRTGPVVIINRPGAVQTNIRIGGPAVDRHHPAYAAQRLASTIFGGYFSSRLVSNIREDKGYTYSPRSSLDYPVAGSRFTVTADVATDVTGPALLEIFYELGRMALLPVSDEELDAARQYAIGTLALSTATGVGLASTLSALAGAGIGVGYLHDHPAALAKVTARDVLEISAQVFAPTRLVTVLVGDAEKIAAEVGAITEIAPEVVAPGTVTTAADKATASEAAAT
ncbi:M16 family metallopeptidase [Frankia sp. CiP1_Cm_nod2]|uniref:M16 family metallopeptidase n=1 Tax=Frankia sp. CiP1_Cm_nod2 TaxID=2897161 RepID=UPI0020258223